MREVTLQTAEDASGRLDKELGRLVPEELGLSRSRLAALVKAGALLDADGEPLLDPSAKVPAGARLRLMLPEAEGDRVEPEAIPLDVRFEDEHLLVVNKPSGMVVHPAPGALRGTLVGALLHHCAGSLSGIGGVLRPGIVHRIDKDTSGLLAVAKNDRAHQGLAEQFAAHTVDRAYRAFAWGQPDPAEPRLAGLAGVIWESADVLRIGTRIGRHPTDRKRMTVLKSGGRSAVTRARLVQGFGVASEIECRLETGRTHQIRVHMAYVGHSLLGDPVYGRKRPTGDAGLDAVIAGLSGQALHAARLGFVHPVTGERVTCEAELPDELIALRAALAGHVTGG